ncbi:Eco57I restriction-modification methylase domain-containing protein [Cyclobacterium sp. SYSU L10401]|uniref:Eco57I restriction-modification methylase domain-containing protein n=1 Tax=Cyclobacterium sp. SYSU L10401 TaxID=2678657 RepID=UPI0013CFA2E7|nr:TaqI-like C-terminal specificity domain-containing protein [Cyclobacterium sp. SYSU L10401]
MKRPEAIKLIESTFNQAFDEDRFTLFIKNFLNDIDTNRYNEFKGAYVKEAYRDHVTQYKRIGKYIDPEGEALDVLIVELKDQSKLDRTRTALRNFVLTHLEQREKDYALVAFYSKSDNGADWRFSFVKLEYRTEVNKGKLKQKKQLTPAKRYSFLVGEHEKAHTAKSQLIPLLQNIYNNPTIEQIEEAFSIETVTDEFFEQYKLLFGKLVEQFDKDSTLLVELKSSNIDTSRFAKKLLGQIVFLYFLQKKGWMGVDKEQPWGKGNKRFIQSLYDRALSENKNFFNTSLQTLFYKALAKEHNDHGIKGYFAELKCRIPFLNGGLFEADYDWQKANISIPNGLFRNDEKLKSGDEGTGILDVFDRYNFTIKEDEPLEKEVAVDPEMLGKVFENMLEVTERKSKGAFYTPREIVHYMCQESLINYLDNSINNYTPTYQGLGNDQLSITPDEKKGQQLLNIEHSNVNVPLVDLEEFIRKGFFMLENDLRVLREGKETRTYKFQLPESIRTHADALDKYISKIKICDPAIGSGAFPVGLLLELVNAQLVLKQYLSPRYFKEKLKTIGLTQEEYESNESRYIYRLKRHTIQESIYGVDIDASAIDVARLRLWLSLVVDEEDLDNIEALPNLDYKIVCGNSLIGLPSQGVARYPTLSNELEELKAKFFKETNQDEKESLRNQINEKIAHVLRAAEDFEGYKIDFDFTLFFSEVWREKGGFDVVIGNPPYLRIQGIREANSTIADILVRLFDSATGSFDLYVCFAEKGLSLTHPKGLLNFIMPVKWTNSAFGKGLRKVLWQSKAGQRIISFSAHQVFNASTYTGIQFFQRNTKKLYYVELNKDLPNKSDLEGFISELSEKDFNSYDTKHLKESAWTLTSNKVGKVLDKLSNNINSVDKTFAKIFQGLATGRDPVYYLVDCKKIGEHIEGYSKELDRRVIIERQFTKPLLKGDQVHRFQKLTRENYVVFPYEFIEGRARLMEEQAIIKSFPKGYEYLKFNEKILRNREKGRFDIDGSWFQFSRGQGLNYGTIPKLFCPDISSNGNFTYDKEGEFYGTATLYGYIKNESSSHPYGFYLSILNSSVCWYFLKNTGTVLANGYFRFKPDYLKPFPIPEVKAEFAELINSICNYLLFLDSQKRVLYDFFELLLDSVILELYFPTEIRSAQKQIIQHLEGIQPISDEMTEEEKFSIIQSEFDRLYSSNHPVKIAVETLDSVEEVRTIREALRK